MLKRFGYLNGVLVVVASAAVVLSTMIPYHMIDERRPDGTVFYGISTNLPDAASYMMWFNQHAQGHILVENRMTVEPHPRLLPNPAWMLIGLYKAVFGSNTLFSYNFMRMMLSLAYLPLLFLVLSKMLPGRRWTWMAWWIIAIGGGLGWLETVGLRVPSADWMTELWSWPSMLHYPHFVLSLILVLLFFLVSMKANRFFIKSLYVLSGVLMALLFMVHPYTAGTILAAIVIMRVVIVWLKKRNTIGTVQLDPAFWWVIGISAPAVIALLLQNHFNPVAAAWASQNHMPSPPIWEYVFGFGLPGVAAGLLVARMVRTRVPESPEIMFGMVWLGTALVLAYADPLVPFARRCMEGVHLIVVVMGVRYVAGIASKRIRVAAVVLMLATTLPAPLYHINREVVPDNPGYVPEDMYEMLDAVRYWVKDGNVISDPRTSLFIAAETDAHVFIAHHEVTPGFLDKIRTHYKYLTEPTTLKERLQLMRDVNCPWAVSTPELAYGMLKTENIDAEDLKKVREFARGKSWVLLGLVDHQTSEGDGSEQQRSQ